jgi:putative peptidoglycan lipid II flippase
MFILVGLFGQAVGVASYPFMAKLAAQGKIDELNNLLNTTMKFLLLVIPVSVLFMVLRHEIVLILFQRGRFGLEATRVTSQVLPFLLCGTFAFAAQTVVVRGYYATQNTWFPALVGTISVVLTLPLFYVLMTVMDARGVALALSLAATAQTLILFELWNRKSHNRNGRSVYRFLISMVMLSAGIGFLLWKFAAILKGVIDASTLPGALLVCIVTGLLFVLMFTLAGTLFKIEEINRFNQKILRKLRH